jgi:integrase
MKKHFKFTNANLKNIKPHDKNSPSSELELSHDGDVSGLKLLVGKSGSKRFLLRYSFQSTRKSILIGKLGDIDVNQAIKIAKKFQAHIADGTDPKAEKDSYKTMPTISEFFWNTYLPMIKVKKRDWISDVQRFKKHIEIRVGNLRYKDLKPIDVLHLQQYIANPKKIKYAYAPATNNRILAVLKTCTNYALKLGVVETNAALPIGLLKEDNIREKYFDAEQTKQIIIAALNYHSPYIGGAIAMLFICGNRKSEVFGIKWCNFNRDNKTAFVEHSKSGKPYTIQLPEIAMDIINKLVKKPNNPYIFAGRREGKCLKDPRTAYHHILESAGITDFEGICFHSARHTCATLMAMSGIFTQFDIKQQLKHTSLQSCERYIKHSPERSKMVSSSFAELIQ